MTQRLVVWTKAQYDQYISGGGIVPENYSIKISDASAGTPNLYTGTGTNTPVSGNVGGGGGGTVFEDWAANTAYAAGDKVIATVAIGAIGVGSRLRRKTAGIARATFDATEALVWDEMVIDDDVIPKTDIVDNLITNDATKVLSAKQGKELQDLKSPLASPTFTGTVAGITKGMVGLGLADNTADINKIISTAQQTALDLKVDKITGKGLSANDFTTAEQTKLSGIATGATANATDAQLRDRSTHTGSQAESTITNLTTDLAAKEATANKGVANGYAPLGANLLVPAANLPTFATSLRLMNPTDIIEDTDRAIYLLAEDLAVGAVAIWANPGIGGDFDQAIVGSQPTVEAVATLGDRNAALFDSTSDFMESAANISLGTRYGLFAVIRTGNSIGGAGITMPILSEIFSGGTVEYMFGLENGKFGVGHYNGAWRNYDATNPIPAINTPYIMIAGYDGANLIVKVDGGTASTAAQTSNPTLTEANNIRLGRRWDGVAGTGLVWNGHIACVIAKRNAYFTATEISQLEGWAAWYYGRVASLPAGHTYKTAPPLLTA